MQQDSSTHTLMAAGAQTIREVAVMRPVLLAALRPSEGGVPPDVTLDCRSVTAADLCFVQLLIAASRSAAAAGGRFALQSEPDGALRAVLLRGGFLGSKDAKSADDPSAWCGRDALAGVSP